MQLQYYAPTIGLSLNRLMQLSPRRTSWPSIPMQHGILAPDERCRLIHIILKLGLSKVYPIVICKMLPKKITTPFALPGSRTAAVCPPHCGCLEHQPIPEPNAFCVGWCKCSSMPHVQTPIFQNLQCKSVWALTSTYQNLVVPNEAQREVACSGQSPALPVGKGLDVPDGFPTSQDGVWCSWICNMDCTLGSATFYCLKQMQHCPSQPPTVSPSKVLHDMAGNSMCIRVVMALLAAALGATRPEMMANIWTWHELESWKKKGWAVRKHPKG